MAHYMAAVLTFTRAVTEEGVTALQSDHHHLVAFFQQHCNPERVLNLAAPLHRLKEVAAADSVDTFVLTYTTLLQVIITCSLVPQPCTALICCYAATVLYDICSHVMT